MTSSPPPLTRAPAVAHTLLGCSENTEEQDTTRLNIKTDEEASSSRGTVCAEYLYRGQVLLLHFLTRRQNFPLVIFYLFDQSLVFCLNGLQTQPARQLHSSVQCQSDILQHQSHNSPSSVHYQSDILNHQSVIGPTFSISPSLV